MSIEKDRIDEIEKMMDLSLNMEPIELVIETLFQGWFLSRFSGFFYSMDHAFTHFCREGKWADERISEELKKFIGDYGFETWVEKITEFKAELEKTLLRRLKPVVK
jgi:hypothetical protein